MKLLSIFNQSVHLATLKHCLLMILLATTVLGCSESAIDVEQNVKRHIKQANLYLKQGQFRAATIEARNAIQKNPNNIEGHIVMANIFLGLGQYKDAVSQLEPLAENDSSNAGLSRALVEGYLGRAKYQSANSTLKANAEVLESLGVSYKILQAKTLFGLGEKKTAIDLITATVTEYSNSVEALLAQAQFNAQLSQFDNIESILAKIEALDPRHAETDFFRAQVSMFKGDFATAESQLTEALSNLPNADVMTPEKSSLLNMLAHALTQQGKSAEALIYTQKLADAFPGSELAEGEFREASELFNKGEYQQAEVILTKLVDQYPSFENASAMLAVIKFRSGENELAADYFNSFIDPEITNPKLTKMAALADLRSNKPERVVELLEEHVKIHEDSQLLIIYGYAAIASKNVVKGKAALNRAIELDPSAPEPYLALARQTLKDDPSQTQEAQDLLNKGYSKNKKNVQMAAALAQVLLAQNDDSAAAKIIDEQLELHEKNEQSLELAGDFYQYQKQYDKAADNYEQALERNPSSFSSAIKLALLSLENEDYPSQLSAFKRAAQINPEHAQPYQGILSAAQSDSEVSDSETTIANLAEKSTSGIGYAVLSQFFSERQNIPKAKLYAEAFTNNSQDPRLSDSVQLSLLLAETQQYLGQENFSAAKESVLAGLKLAPQSGLFMTLLIELEVHSGNVQEADKLIQRLSQSEPAQAHQLRGDLFISQQQYPEAIESYRDAWDKEPNEVRGNKLYASLRVHQTDQADAFLRQWSETLPNSLEAMSIESTNYLVSSNYAAAITIMEKIQKLSPDYVQNLNNLAWAYQQIDNSKALGVAKQAYQLAPKWASIVDTYGWILFENGQIAEATKILEQASQLEPDNDEIKNHLEAAKKARQ